MIEVYIDGASAGNPGLSGAGVFIKGNGLNDRYSIPLWERTNHEAEFLALIHALGICVENGYKTVSFRSDSQLVCDAMEKESVKNEYFAEYLERALNLTKKLDLFFIKWIPSRQNKVADELARKAIRNISENDKKKKKFINS